MTEGACERGGEVPIAKAAALRGNSPREVDKIPTCVPGLFITFPSFSLTMTRAAFSQIRLALLLLLDLEQQSPVDAGQDTTKGNSSANECV